MLQEGMDMLEIADAHFGDFVRYHRGIGLYADLLARKNRKSENPICQKLLCISDQLDAVNRTIAGMIQSIERMGIDIWSSPNLKCTSMGIPVNQSSGLTSLEVQHSPSEYFCNSVTNGDVESKLKEARSRSLSRRSSFQLLSGQVHGGEEVPSISLTQSSYLEDCPEFIMSDQKLKNHDFWSQTEYDYQRITPTTLCGSPERVTSFGTNKRD